MEIRHAFIIALDIIGLSATLWAAIALNVRYNRGIPYAPWGFMLTRAFGAAGGLVCSVIVYVLSLFW